LGTLETEVFGHVVAVDSSTARLAQLGTASPASAPTG